MKNFEAILLAVLAAANSIDTIFAQSDGPGHRELAECVQEVNFIPQECKQNRCTSKDLSVVGASVDLGVCFQCEPCETVTGTLILAIDNDTGSTRTTFGYGGTLVEVRDPACDGAGKETRCVDSRCQDGGALLPMTITPQEFGTFEYTCGSKLSFKDVYQFWSPASGGFDCSSYDICKDIYPKCGVQPNIEIASPLTIQEESAKCLDDGTLDISINVDVFGGTPPYTYFWTDSDGFEVATTEDLLEFPDGTYTLTVTDSEGDGGCKTSRSFGPYGCCFFEAACLDNVDRTLECDASVPAPLTQDAIFKSNPSVACGDLVFDSSNSTSKGGCPNEATITRSYALSDDLNQPLECTQTITIQDTTPPVIQGCPADISINICKEPVPDAPVLTAEDACDGTVTVDGPDCCFTGTGITRTWTSTDGCGNEAVACVQKITFKEDCAV